MIEKTIRDYLKVKLTVPVYLDVPNDPPAKYVRLEKTGSSNESRITSSTIAIQSIAESLYDAAALNESVKEAALEAVGVKEISNVRLNSDYNYTDQKTKKYRYQAVFDITHY